jgi:hypothetical protein
LDRTFLNPKEAREYTVRIGALARRAMAALLPVPVCPLGQSPRRAVCTIVAHPRCRRSKQANYALKQCNNRLHVHQFSALSDASAL